MVAWRKRSSALYSRRSVDNRSLLQPFRWSDPMVASQLLALSQYTTPVAWILVEVLRGGFPCVSVRDARNHSRGEHRKPCIAPTIACSKCRTEGELKHASKRERKRRLSEHAIGIQSTRSVRRTRSKSIAMKCAARGTGIGFGGGGGFVRVWTSSRAEGQRRGASEKRFRRGRERAAKGQRMTSKGQ